MHIHVVAGAAGKQILTPTEGNQEASGRSAPCRRHGTSVGSFIGSRKTPPAVRKVSLPRPGQQCPIEWRCSPTMHLYRDPRYHRRDMTREKKPK
ncbi:hypothetical protein LY78DRAFT_660937 [Colletotrichum sublineola]|nr:hypothetical protein LY78DRAFT_660937 [Colletotrichum sublineola]